jgi:hypothetical protein
MQTMIQHNSFRQLKKYRSEFLREYAASVSAFGIVVEITPAADGMDEVTLHYDTERIDPFMVGLVVGQKNRFWK